ncbi:hypothetical protein NQ318_022005 [Aromia moschata]|uniref:lysozyme n=1 Tax=Aromia moschata TaxID=1265417 RepID=A0AAV8Z735_9CUCU|nr:hypothetical protein NQ318_022005 [Aromia moschata]
MPLKRAFLLAIFSSMFSLVVAKIYDRCELARELKHVHHFPDREIPTWVCIAAHESIYDTAAMNPGSGDHGLFQISQLYWCSPPGDGFGCNAPCSSFRDDDITDDVRCVRRIFKEHSRISGDGFNAWAVYSLYCKTDTERYVNGCFEDDVDNSVVTSEAANSEAPLGEDDDGYEFPPLPSPPKKTLENVIGSQEDVYEFPPLPTIHNKGSSTSTRLFTQAYAESTTKQVPFKQASGESAFSNKKFLLVTQSGVKQPDTVSVTIRPRFQQFTTLRSKGFSSYATPSPKQLTYKPFFGISEVVFTLKPAPPRPIRPSDLNLPALRPPKPLGSRFNKNPSSNDHTLRPFVSSKPFSGAPVLMSFPHLLYADQEYLASVKGLKPNKELHENFVTLEPM